MTSVACGEAESDNEEEGDVESEEEGVESDDVGAESEAMGVGSEDETEGAGLDEGTFDDVGVDPEDEDEDAAFDAAGRTTSALDIGALLELDEFKFIMRTSRKMTFPNMISSTNKIPHKSQSGLFSLFLLPKLLASPLEPPERLGRRLRTKRALTLLPAR